MTPKDIIKTNAVQAGVDPDQALAGVSRAMHYGGKMLQEGDSLLLLTPLRGSKENMFLHLFSVAQPSVAFKDTQAFIKQVKSMKSLKRVYGDAKDPQITRMLTMAGVDVLKSDIPQFTWMAEV
jgi:hypothetical protein